MGCDIHAFMEVKIKGEWLHYGPNRLARSYALFTMLAGVRDYGDGIKVIDEPRGLPEDMTYMTRLHAESWSSDAHSHSWVTSDEYADVVKAVRELEGGASYMGRYNFDSLYLFGNGFDGFKKYPEDYDKSVEDFRMVFWFDN